MTLRIIMFSKIGILLLAIVCCDAKIDVSNNNARKCEITDMACFVTDFNRVIRATAYPIEKYNIQGYDTVKIEPFSLIRPFFNIDQSIDVTVNGLANTTLRRINFFGVRKGQNVFELEYEHNIEFSGNARIDFHVGPDNDVVKEGPIAGKIVGLRSVFVAPISVTEKDGKEYYDIGKEQLLRIVVINEPELDYNSARYFMGDKATSPLIKKMRDNKQYYYYDVARKLVEGFATTFFTEHRKFFNNVPRSEFGSPEEESSDKADSENNI